MTRKLAQTLLAVQDLINYPIQTLVVDTELLRSQHPDVLNISDRIQRSILKLERLNKLVAQQAEKILPQEGDESFDPLSILENIQKK